MQLLEHPDRRRYYQALVPQDQFGEYFQLRVHWGCLQVLTCSLE